MKAPRGKKRTGAGADGSAGVRSASARGNPVTGMVGAVVEAWAELRIHKTRVLLSLIGVAVAVTAITVVVGLGQIAQQALTESSERGSGRPARLVVSGYSNLGVVPSAEVMNTAFDVAVERYGVSHASRSAWITQGVQFADGKMDVYGQAVDIDYGTMHRVRLTEGLWFTAYDEERLAPALIVNEVFWQRLGSPALDTHPTVQLTGDTPTTGVVVGVTPSAPNDSQLAMTILYSAYERLASPEMLVAQSPQYEMWVPPETSDLIAPLVQRDIAAAIGDGFIASAQRQDYLAWSDGDQLLPFKLVVGGVAAIVLLLGALGLVNISLVTVRHRIREIGIRRSFGATAGRVFFAVMMESIVATFVAGVFGVILAILIVENPWVQELIGQGVTDLPAFPMEAALIGLLASVGVGALAGLLPAIVAVRVKVIDAIRF